MADRNDGDDQDGRLESLEALWATKDALRRERESDDEANLGELLMSGGHAVEQERAVRVLPRQTDEFVCTSCRMIVHRSREVAGTGHCVDCA